MKFLLCGEGTCVCLERFRLESTCDWDKFRMAQICIYIYHPANHTVYSNMNQATISKEFPVDFNYREREGVWSYQDSS